MSQQYAKCAISACVKTLSGMSPEAPPEIMGMRLECAKWYVHTPLAGLNWRGVQCPQARYR